MVRILISVNYHFVAETSKLNGGKDANINSPTPGILRAAQKERRRKIKLAL
jgi:hypothetical protein